MNNILNPYDRKKIPPSNRWCPQKQAYYLRQLTSSTNCVFKVIASCHCGIDAGEPDSEKLLRAKHFKTFPVN